MRPCPTVTLTVAWALAPAAISSASRSTTCNPARRGSSAGVSPTMPAPTTTASARSSLDMGAYLGAGAVAIQRERLSGAAESSGGVNLRVDIVHLLLGRRRHCLRLFLTLLHERVLGGLGGSGRCFAGDRLSPLRHLVAEVSRFQPNPVGRRPELLVLHARGGDQRAYHEPDRGGAYREAERILFREPDALARVLAHPRDAVLHGLARLRCHRPGLRRHLSRSSLHTPEGAVGGLGDLVAC